MKTSVLIIMIALLSAFTVNSVFAQAEDLKQKKTPEERAQKFSEKMGTALSLTSDQQSQAYSIMLSHFQQADQIRAAETDKDSKRSKIKALRQSTDAQLKAILTADYMNIDHCS